MPAPLQPGEWRVERADNWTNVWIDQRPNVLVDYEAIDSRLGIATGLSRSTQIQFVIDGRIETGGRLDGLIEDFHRVIGNHDTRDTVPRNTVHVPRSLASPRRAVEATVTKRFGDFASSVSVRNANGVDAGTSLAWSREVSNTTIHLGAGLSRFAHVAPAERTFFAAAVHPMTERTAVIAQYLFNSGIAESGPLATASHEVTVGARFQATANTAVDAGIVENVFNFENGPDFGFHFGLVYDTGRRH